MKIQFLGAIDTVTGSRTLIEYQEEKFLIDCGLFQGPYDIRSRNWNELSCAKEVKSVILTHAHIDHSGYIPKFVKEGFTGPIYCTDATKELSEIMLIDAAHLQEEDAKFANETKYSRYKPALPLYTVRDAEKSISQFRSVALNKWIQLQENLSFRLIRSGHILGSSFAQISFLTHNGPKILTFSGDLGNGRSVILEDPEYISETDFLVMESTYGDRRQDRSNPQIQLAAIIQKVIGRGGTLVIPAFSVGRTQELLYLISRLLKLNAIPQIPVYLDSPMATSVTQVYKKHTEYLKKEIREGELKDTLSNLTYKEIEDANESMLLCMSDEPKVVISAAGMLTGGRVMHHLKCKLPNEKNGILFVGYQSQGTKGALLKNGFKKIRIHHKEIDVEAEIFSIDTLSAHADSDDILSWMSHIKKPPELVLLNHGEAQSTSTLAYRLRNEMKLNVVIPKIEENIIL